MQQLPDRYVQHRKNKGTPAALPEGRSINPLDHLGLARRQAYIYHQKTRHPYEELYQEALVELIKACDAFEPDRGLKFSTYALPRIRGGILHFLRAEMGRSEKGYVRNKPHYKARSLHTVEEDYGRAFVDWRQIDQAQIQEEWEAIAGLWGSNWEQHLNSRMARQVVQLCVIEGLTRSKAAEAIGCAQPSVSRSLKRSLSLLRQRYLEQCGEAG